MVSKRCWSVQYQRMLGRLSAIEKGASVSLILSAFIVP